MKKIFSERKKLLSLFFAFAMTFSLFFVGASAENVNDATVQSYEAQIDELTKKQEAAQAKIDAAQNDIDNIMGYKAALDESIGYTYRKIETANAMIAELDRTIAEKQDLIAATEEKIKDTRAALLRRMSAMNETDKATYLDILLGSADLFDFLTKVDQITTLMQYDKDVIATLTAYKQDIKNSLAEIDAAKETQQETLTMLSAEQDNLTNLSAESVSSLNRLYDDKNAWEAEYAAAAAAQAQIDAELTQYLAEVQSQTQKVFIGGDFMWPLPVEGTGISSHYGGRELNGAYEWHPATDIWAPAGTTIFASNGGEVLRSEYNSSYGNYVVIDHGDGKSTLYAHMTATNVSAGQTVSKGDVIGFVGNTGYSFGNHLHFEFRINGEKVDAEGYVPAPY